MLEWTLIPLAVGAATLVPRMERNDRKKIDQIFKNLNIGVVENERPRYPRYLRKVTLCGNNDNRVGISYIYSLPLGISGTKLSKAEKESGVFEQGLRKPVKLKVGDGVLNVNVYDKKIPTNTPYSSVPVVEGWKVPIGLNQEGYVWHDFDRTPHMTVAGTTRFGKTVLLKEMVTYLIERHPEDVEIYIIDLKGGLEFNRYRKLRQVKAVASNPMEALEMLHGVHAHLENSHVSFLHSGINNVVDSDIQTRKFVIVDEAAQLCPAKGLPKEVNKAMEMCQYYLSEIARVAGALGYRLIFCTQYPTSDTLPRQVKQNADAKITFRLPTGYASEVAIDDRGAEELPTDIPGRAIFKTHELTHLQVPYISDKEMWKRLEVYQDVIECREENVETGGDFRELD